MPDFFEALDIRLLISHDIDRSACIFILQWHTFTASHYYTPDTSASLRPKFQRLSLITPILFHATDIY